MLAREMMTANPICCLPTDSIHQVAQQMATHSVGLLPVIENPQSMKLIGVITDRDIVCRVDANGQDCRSATVQDAMTTGQLWTVKPADDVSRVITEMEQGQVRRIPVI